MTNHQPPTDEDLMAYADGELPPGRRDAIAVMIAADPRLGERVETFRRSREVVKRALAPIAAEPVPEALRRAIEAKLAKEREAPPAAAAVIPFPPPRIARPASRWQWPLAASIAALAAALAGYGVGTSSRPGAEVAEYAVDAPLGGALARALSREASGGEIAAADGRIRTIASFSGRGDVLCREFEVDKPGGRTIMGLACREDDQWRLRIAVAAPGVAEGYAPASSVTAIESYLNAIEAGEPLTAEDERRVLAGLGSKEK